MVIRESERQSVPVEVDVFGPFAGFSRPENSIERITYDVPTPSACRNILNRIYLKPSEFYYQIRSIEVMNPIRTIQIRRNEVKNRISSRHPVPIYVEDCHTPRMTTYLRNVYYRIHADMILRPDHPVSVTTAGVFAQFRNRVEKGKCFAPPFLGYSECTAYFAPPDPGKTPIQESRDLGLMLYDIFDPRDNVPLDTKLGKGSMCISYFYARLENGVVSVPPYESEEILKSEKISAWAHG